MAIKQVGQTLEIIFITIPITLIFIGTGAIIFFWASKKGQFDDLDSPAHRILFDDDMPPQTKKIIQEESTPDKLKADPTKNE